MSIFFIYIIRNRGIKVFEKNQLNLKKEYSAD